MDSLLQAINLLKKATDDSFRGGDPVLAAEKRNEMQSLKDEEMNSVEFDRSLEKGEGEWRGGDPEEAQRKRTETIEDKKDSGEWEEQKEEDALQAELGDTDEAEMEEERQRQEDADAIKSIPVGSSTVAPINSGTDYVPHSLNGQVLDPSEKKSYPDIDPTKETRPGKNQHKIWSEVVGMKLPFNGNPWMELRRYALLGDFEGYERERNHLLKSMFPEIEGYEAHVSEAAQKGLLRLLYMNHGLCFDPQIFSKALEDGSIGKYVHRSLGENGWKHSFTDGVHNNHGLAHLGDVQGHTVEVHPDWHAYKGSEHYTNPKAAFDFTRQKALEQNSVHRVQFRKPGSNEPVEQALVVRGSMSRTGAKQGKPFAKPIELHDIPKDAKELKHSDFKSAKAKQSFAEWGHYDDHYRKVHGVKTEVDPEGNPYLHWYPSANEGGAPSVKFAENHPLNPHYQIAAKQTADGFSRPFKTVHHLKNHMQELHNRMLDHKAKQVAKFTLPKDFHSVEKPITKLISSGALLPYKKNVRIPKKLEEGQNITQGSTHYNTTRLEFTPEDEKFLREKLNISPEHSSIHNYLANKIFEENEGYIRGTLSNAVRNASRKRVSVGKVPIPFDKQDAMVEDLVSHAPHNIHGSIHKYSPVHMGREGTATHIPYENYLARTLLGHTQGQLGNLMSDHGLLAPAKDPHELLAGVDSSQTLDKLTPINMRENRDTHNADIKKNGALEFEDPKEYIKRAIPHVIQNLTKHQENVPENEHPALQKKLNEMTSHLAKLAKKPDLDHSDIVELTSHWNGGDNGFGFDVLPPLDIKNKDSFEKRQAQVAAKIKQKNKLRDLHGPERTNFPLHNLHSVLEDTGEDPLTSNVRKRIDEEGLKTVGDLLTSFEHNPFKERRDQSEAARLHDILTENKYFIDRYGHTPGSLNKAIRKAVNVLPGVENKVLPKNNEQDLNYVGKFGEIQAPSFFYESHNGNLISGKNAPEEHQDHDPLFGDPQLDIQKLSTENAPAFFDAQGRKLNQPVPENFPAEDNKDYDPEIKNGNFWAKRYQHPESGDYQYLYLHRDHILNPKLRKNHQIRLVDSQLPKFRAWYQGFIVNVEHADKMLSLVSALLDQGGFRFQHCLDNLTVGDVKVINRSDTLFNVSQGQYPCSLEHPYMNVLQEALRDKNNDDFVFSFNGKPFNYQVYAIYLRDQFGFTPEDLFSYSVTKRYSELFTEKLKKIKFLHSLDALNQLKQELFIEIKTEFPLQDERDLEDVLDPITKEALLMVAYFGYLSKGGGGSGPGEHTLKAVRQIRGLKIAIENHEGSVRHWYDENKNQKGQTYMHYDYGYVRGSEGVDGDACDVYLGPNEESDRVFVVRQQKSPDFKEYDEDKIMLFFSSPEEAKAAYLKQYDNPKFFGSMSELSFEDFKKKVLNTKNNPGMIKSLVVVKPIQSTEDNLFSKWLHSYPLHDHVTHWEKMMEVIRQTRADEISKLGIASEPLNPEVM